MTKNGCQNPDQIRDYRRGCFFAREGTWERGPMPPCGGPMQQAHLIPKQLLRRRRLELWDPATWVWGCQDHHAAFDFARTLRVARSAIPKSTEQFAKAHGLRWFLDRTYR